MYRIFSRLITIVAQIETRSSAALGGNEALLSFRPLDYQDVHFFCLKFRLF